MRCYKGLQAATLQRTLVKKGETRVLDRNPDGRAVILKKKRLHGTQAATLQRTAG